MVSKFLTLSFLSALAFAAIAEDGTKVRRGLYWYEKPPVAEEEAQTKNEEEAPPKYVMPYVPPLDVLMTLHPKEISALFEEVHEFHVMQPTLETASEVQKLKAVMNKKARAAAAVEQLAILQNPSLSGVAENAVNPSARSVQRKEKQDSIEARLLQDRDDFALVMLSQPNCGACVLQRNVIASFADRFGWPIKEVNIIESPEAGSRFDVRVTPTTLIASKKSGQWQTVAIGSETLPTLMNNVHQAARLLAGEIKPNQWLTAPNQTQSLYDPNFK